MSEPFVSERVLFLYAHPADESRITGGAIARLVSDGSHVTVVTITRGEQGSGTSDSLSSAKDTEALAGKREEELSNALKALGVTDHRFLGDTGARGSGLSPRRYLDSGMTRDVMGMPAPHSGTIDGTPDPAALVVADFDEVLADFLAVVDEVEPTAVVSYDENGENRHPDRIVAHRIAVEAGGRRNIAVFAADPVGAVAVELSDDELRRKREAMRAYETYSAIQANGEGDAHVPATQQPPLPNERVESFRVAAESLSGSTLEATHMGDSRVPTMEPEDKRTVWSGIRTCAVTFLAGVVFGALATTVHQATLDIGDFPLPIGLIIALVTVAALMLSIRLLVRERFGAVLCAVGLIGIVSAYSFPGLGGSVLIPDNILGSLWAVTPAIIAVVVVLWPAARMRRFTEPLRTMDTNAPSSNSTQMRREHS